MGLQLRWAWLTFQRIYCLRSHACTYHTVAQNASWDSKNCDGFQEALKELYLAKVQAEELVMSTKSHKNNTRLGTFFYNGHKIARHLRRQFSNNKIPMSSERVQSLQQTKKLATHGLTPLEWKDTTTKLNWEIVPIDTEGLDPNPMLICKNPSVLTETITSLNSSLKPLKLTEDDIILWSSKNHVYPHLKESTEKMTIDLNVLMSENLLHKYGKRVQPKKLGKIRNQEYNKQLYSKVSDELITDLSVNNIRSNDDAKSACEVLNVMSEEKQFTDMSQTTFFNLNNCDNLPVVQKIKTQDEAVIKMTDLGDSTGRTPSKQPSTSGKPSAEQLQLVHDHFAKTIPNFFVEMLDYNIYTQHVVLENNFSRTPRIYRGISAYVIQVFKLRAWARFKFSNVKVVLLSITQNKENGTICVRWRITGIPQWESIKIWKFFPWKYKKSKEDVSKWHDGYSQFYVGTDGKVYRHTVDRVMPDEELQEAKVGGLAVKIAAIVGGSRNPSVGGV